MSVSDLEIIKQGLSNEFIKKLKEEYPLSFINKDQDMKNINLYDQKKKEKFWWWWEETHYMQIPFNKHWF